MVTYQATYCIKHTDGSTTYTSKPYKSFSDAYIDLDEEIERMAETGVKTEDIAFLRVINNSKQIAHLDFKDVYERLWKELKSEVNTDKSTPFKDSGIDEVIALLNEARLELVATKELP